MDGQSLALIITTIGGFATLVFKSMHDMSVKKQQREEDRQDRLAAAAQAKAEREDEARKVRERLEATAIQQVQFTQGALNDQTAQLARAIDEAKRQLEMQANSAFEASNDTNTKIAKLNARLVELGTVLASLVAAAGRHGGEQSP